MARLPAVGSDDGTWGSILNEFLQVGHNADGSLKTPYINIKNFGAKGDGSTNDSSTIQAAVNSISSGGMVFIPAGTYVIGSKINIPSNVAIIGVGGASILKAANGLNDSVIGNADISGGNNRIYLANFTVNGNKANQTTSGIGVHLRTATECRVENVNVEDCFWIGIYSANGKHNLISNCIIKGTSGHSSAIAVLLEETGSQITGCRLFSNTTQGISVGGTGCLVTHNIIDGVITWQGICLRNGVSGAAILNNHITNTETDGIGNEGTATDCRIEGNYIDTGRDGDAIILGGTSNGNIIKGNTLVNSSAGGVILSDGQFGNIIEGNVIRNAFTNGIALARSHSNLIRGNYIINSGLNGISMDECSNNVIVGNMVKNNGARNNAADNIGINMWNNSNNNIVENNRCFDDKSVKTQAVGIRKDPTTGTNNLIIGNIVKGNLTNGISGFEAQDGDIVDHNIE